MRRHSMRSARMVWDRDGRSWATFGVTYQPFTVVLGTDGRVLARSAGSFDPAAVERALQPGPA